MNDQQRAALREALAQHPMDYDQGFVDGVEEGLAMAEPQEQDLAYREAKSLAEHLFKKHYASQEDYASGRIVWGVCDTTAGIITQIDNMVCKLELPLAQPQVASKQFHEWAVTEHEKIKAQPQDHSEQHLNMVQGEWVDLTQEDVSEVYHANATLGIEAVVRAVIAKFKEKNTPPVVPQGEPVAGSDDDTDKAAELGWHLQAQINAAIEATKEKAAKVCEELGVKGDSESKEYAGWFAAAIRSMK